MVKTGSETNSTQNFVSDSFCNFTKQIIRQAIGQVCGGEKADKSLNFSFKLSFFSSLQNYFCLFLCVQMSATL